MGGQVGIDDRFQSQVPAQPIGAPGIGGHELVLGPGRFAVQRLADAAQVLGAALDGVPIPDPQAAAGEGVADCVLRPQFGLDAAQVKDLAAAGLGAGEEQGDLAPLEPDFRLVQSLFRAEDVVPAAMVGVLLPAGAAQGGLAVGRGAGPGDLVGGQEPQAAAAFDLGRPGRLLGQSQALALEIGVHILTPDAIDAPHFAGRNLRLLHQAIDGLVVHPQVLGYLFDAQKFFHRLSFPPGSAPAGPRVGLLYQHFRHLSSLYQDYPLSYGNRTLTPARAGLQFGAKQGSDTDFHR